MKKLIKVWREHSLWLMFLSSIFLVGIVNLPNLSDAINAQYNSKSLDTSITETNYEDNFWHHEDFIDIQGEIAKVSGQRINNGVIKGLDNSLYLLEDVEYTYDENIERKKCEDALAILETAKEEGADVLYASRVYKTGKLPYGYTFQQDKQYEFWGQTISNQGIPVLDVKAELGEQLEFYKTDHHWTVETAFNAAREMVDELNQEYNLDLDTDIFERDNYKASVWRNSFLGSMGIRTGKYFVGKDDFVILEPLFETNLTYEHYIDGVLQKKTSGNFTEAFVDLSILNDTNYNNKYNACLNGGYVENVIVNHQQEEGLKLLVISDSFARPVVQYISLCFGETRYLDPQEGRYNDSYIEYIEEFQPDVVVMMYSGEFTKI